MTIRNPRGWLVRNEAYVRRLRDMEGMPIDMIAKEMGVHPSTAHEQCRIAGVSYDKATAPHGHKPATGTWRPPEQYPSIWAFARGVTLRDLQGARS
jgi:hypothetical protein